jgi:outer membrane protein OmpA-like peptidoglycan-associated protein
MIRHRAIRRRSLLRAASLNALMLGCAFIAARAQSPAESPTQPSALIGAGASIGTTSITTSIPFYGADRSCGEWTSGTAAPFGGSFVLRLPSLVADRLGATLRLGVSTQSAELVGVPLDPMRQLDPTTGSLADVTRELRLESSLSTLHVDALAGVTIGGLSVWAGPSLGMRYEVEQSVADVITAPSFARFRDGAREREIPIAPELADAPISLGGVADVAYTIALGPELYVSPHVGVRLEPASPYQGFDWSQTTFGGGVDILFAALPTKPPAPIVVVPERRDTVAVVRELEVVLRALDSTLAPTGDAPEVIYREVIERRHVPLIPAVFFDSASATLPARLQRFDADRKPADVARTLAELTTMQAQGSLLNVIGERLRANPQLQVTLIGSWSGNEDRTLGHARSEAVRGYLVDVWRLDPSQVVIGEDRRSLRLSSEADAEGREENRRVEIISTTADALRPVFVERQVEQAVVPLRVRLDAVATMPVRVWSATLGDGSRELVRLDTTTAGSTLSHLFVVTPEQITTQASTVRATLTATPDSGAAISRTLSIPVTWRREQTFIEGGTERSADRERTTWQVLGFGFNSSDLLERHREEIRTIGSLVGASARVTITGYSDRLGDQKRNLELSRERAERVAAALREELARRGRAEVTIEATGAGVDETRFSNDLPEGRFLSRGATITVEQAAK